MEISSRFEEVDLGFASELIKQLNTANERLFGVKNPTDEDVKKYNILYYVDEETPPKDQNAATSKR